MGLFQKNTSEVPPIAPRLEPIMPNISVPQETQINTPIIQQRTISKETGSGSPEKDEPFFVRIDKFNQAKDNFEDISDKLNELDKLIKRMDDLKIKEDQEISEFKNGTESIKQTLTQVDREIFSKL
jgi:uncharacterized protein YdcH (DUF465 family)